MGKECDLGQQGRRLVAAQAGTGRGAIACAGARIEFGEERKQLVPHRIVESGKLRVGMSGAQPPYNMKSKSENEPSKRFRSTKTLSKICRLG